MYGFFNVTLGPLCLTYLSIETYPVEKTFVNGVASVVCHIFLAISSLIVQAFILENPDNPIGAFYYQAAGCAVGAICVLFVKPKNTKQ